MDCFYEMLVHYNKGVSPIELVRVILSQWTTSDRSALLHFPRSGEGVIPTDAFLENRLDFKDEQSVDLRLRTSRKKEADCLELHFTNPQWKMTSTNYCQVRFPINKLNFSLPGYTQKDIVDLFGILIVEEYTKSGFIGLSDVTYSPTFFETHQFLARRRGTGNWPYEINWMTYLSRFAMSNFQDQKLLASSGLIVLRTFADGSCIVWSGDHPDTNHETQRDNLLKIMRNLGLIT